MARGALKMARERLVANVKGGQFDPRAIFFDLHPPLRVKSSLESFQAVDSPQMAARQALGRFFWPAAKSIWEALPYSIVRFGTSNLMLTTRHNAAGF